MNDRNEQNGPQRPEDQEAEEMKKENEAEAKAEESEEPESNRFRKMVGKSKGPSPKPTHRVAPKKSRNPEGDRVFLVRGKAQGDPAWHYVLVDSHKMPQFRRMVAGGSLDVADYGKVIKSGWGENPPDEVILEMKEKYG